MKRVWTHPHILIIQQAVCDYFEMEIEVLLGHQRHRHLARPRQLAMYLSYNCIETSMPELGLAFDRDHTTIMHGINKMIYLLQENPVLIMAHNTIKENLKLPMLPCLKKTI